MEIDAISSAAMELSGARLQFLYEIAALKKQQEAIQAAGEAAIQLIQSAAITDPRVGRNLDLSG